MKHQRDTNIHQSLERQLREQAHTHRRDPSSEMHGRIMTAIGRLPAATGGDIIGRPRFVARRLAAAAAMILIVAIVSLVLRPKAGHEPLVSPRQASVEAPADAAESEAHPQLVQPLIDLAPRFAFDVGSPLDDEAGRMLTDARQASRIILDNLPFRGQAASNSEARGF